MAVAFHVGLEGPFYGCDGLFFKIGETTYVCEEDPSDGYRSYMGNPLIWDGPSYATPHQVGADGQEAPIFFETPLDTVWVCPDETKGEYNGELVFSGWRLISVTSGRTWLRFGTDYSEDYYPHSVWEYTPLHDPNKEVH